VDTRDTIGVKRMSFSSFVFTATIIDTIESFVGPYITQGIDLLTGLAVWLQAAVLAGAAILILIGLFTFIKKTYKMILVLAVIGAIGYFLYTSGTLDSIIAGLNPTTTATTSIWMHIFGALPF